MPQTYLVHIKSYGDHGFVACVDGLRGMVEQANSPRGALEKIMTGLRVKFAYDNKIDISKVRIEEVSEDKPSKPQRKLIIQEA